MQQVNALEAALRRSKPAPTGKPLTDQAVLAAWKRVASEVADVCCLHNPQVNRLKFEMSVAFHHGR